MVSHLVNIAHVDRLNLSPPDPESLVVFVSPIHGFNYPPVMVNFLLRFPKGKNPVVLMNTRAGMLISPSSNVTSITLPVPDPTTWSQKFMFRWNSF